MIKSTKILLATHNPGKLAYFRHAGRGLPFTFLSLADCNITAVAEETGSSLEENATIKAHFYSNLSGLIALADDSGLFIDALAGGPGVTTAEYGGKHLGDDERIEYLLAQLTQVPDHARTARFKSVIAVAFPNGTTHLHHGLLEGIIAREARGTPTPKLPFRRLFLIPAFNKTLDELGLHSDYEKHRAAAFHKAIESVLRYKFSTKIHSG